MNLFLFFLLIWMKIAGRIDSDGGIQQRRFLCHFRHWDAAQSHRRRSSQLRRQWFQRFRRSHRHPQVWLNTSCPQSNDDFKSLCCCCCCCCFSLVRTVWWKCFRVSIGSKVTMAAVLVSPFCVRSVSCAYWNWFDSCPTCAVNWSSCCAPWTTWPSFLPCSFSSFSYSGTILRVIDVGQNLLSVDIFVYNSFSLSTSHTHTHTKLLLYMCVRVCANNLYTRQDPLYDDSIRTHQRERERGFLDGGYYESRARF